MSQSFDPADDLPRTLCQRIHLWRRCGVWRLPAYLYPRLRLQTPAKDPRSPSLSVVVIAIGERYRALAVLLIDSLRSRGDFRDPIYVITDSAETFLADPNVATKVVPSPRTSLIAKICKKYILTWLPVRSALYIDADIIVGSTVADWAEKILHEDKNAIAWFFPDTPSKMPFHGGVMLLRRGRVARKLLRAWRKSLVSGRYTKDQSALRDVSSRFEISHLDDSDLMFPTESDIINGRIARFNHLTRKCRTSVGDDLASRFVRNILG